MEGKCQAHPGPVVGDIVGNVQAFLPIDVWPQGHTWKGQDTLFSQMFITSK